MESTNKEKIGLIAGSGNLPYVLAVAIKSREEYLVGLGIKGEADSSLKKYTDSFHFFEITELNHLKEIIKKENIKKIIMAGKVHKDVLFKGINFDKDTSHILSALSNKGDYHILKAFAEDFEKDGITFLEPSLFIGNLIPLPGVLTTKQPSHLEREDVHFGFAIAKKIAELDIGQTVVVKNKVVLAIECIEGTDETIKRAEKLAKGGVVVKVTKPNQDLRFDMPVIGEDTIDVAHNANISCIAVESHKVIILDRDEIIKKANKFNISIIAV